MIDKKINRRVSYPNIRRIFFYPHDIVLYLNPPVFFFLTTPIDVHLTIIVFFIFFRLIISSHNNVFVFVNIEKSIVSRTK